MVTQNSHQPFSFFFVIFHPTRLSVSAVVSNPACLRPQYDAEISGNTKYGRREKNNFSSPFRSQEIFSRSTHETSPMHPISLAGEMALADLFTNLHVYEFTWGLVDIPTKSASLCHWERLRKWPYKYAFYRKQKILEIRTTSLNQWQYRRSQRYEIYKYISLAFYSTMQT